MGDVDLDRHFLPIPIFSARIDHGHDCVRHLIYMLCFGDMHHLHLVMDLNE